MAPARLAVPALSSCRLVVKSSTAVATPSQSIHARCTMPPLSTARSGALGTDGCGQMWRTGRVGAQTLAGFVQEGCGGPTGAGIHRDVHRSCLILPQEANPAGFHHCGPLFFYPFVWREIRACADD